MEQWPIPSALVTVSEASQLFRLQGNRFRAWVKQGKLRDYSPSTWRILLSLDELRQLVNTKQMPTKCNGAVGRRIAAKQAREANAKAQA